MGPLGRNGPVVSISLALEPPERLHGEALRGLARFGDIHVLDDRVRLRVDDRQLAEASAGDVRLRTVRPDGDLVGSTAEFDRDLLRHLVRGRVDHVDAVGREPVRLGAVRVERDVLHGERE